MIIPGVPAGTMNAEMPSSVRAVTVTIEVMSVPQLVMNAFEPLSTHSSPMNSARVVLPRRLTPVRLRQAERAERRPATSSGSHCSR